MIKFKQALVGKDAQVLEQVPVEAEVRAQHLGDAEGEMAVGHGKEDRFGEERAPLAYDDARHGFRLTDETYTLPPVVTSQ